MNARYGDGTNLARVVLGFSVLDEGGTTRCMFDIDRPGRLTENDTYAKEIMCESEHPFQDGENHGRTKRRLMALAAECFDLAKANTAQCLTRFIYFNLGSTDSSDDQEPIPLMKAVDDRSMSQLQGEVGAQFDIHLNDAGLDFSEVIRESYVPTITGLYPLAGIDDADHTRGLKQFTVQGQAVFDTNSFLEQEWKDPKSITSGLITYKNPYGAGSIRMVAFWPDPSTDHRHYAVPRAAAAATASGCTTRWRTSPARTSRARTRSSTRGTRSRSTSATTARTTTRTRSRR